MRLDLYSEEGKNAQRDWRISKEKNISGCGRAQVIVKPVPSASRSHRGHSGPHTTPQTEIKILGWRSPVIFRRKVTDGDESCSAAHGKLVL